MFRYQLELHQANGQVETHAEDFTGFTLVLGRGGESHILLQGHLVAPEHARFEAHDGALTVTDLSHDAGLWVNGARLSVSPLHDGDEVRLGSVRLTVARRDAVWVLREERHAVDQARLVLSVQKAAQALDIRQVLPGLLPLGTLAVLLIVAWFVVWPAWSGDQTLLASGRVGVPHRLAGQTCAVCHAGAFQDEPAQRCGNCHERWRHGALAQGATAGQGQQPPLCSRCHLEHEGDAWRVVRADRLCTDCHGAIRSVAANAQIANVGSFQDHPEFRVDTGRPGPGGKVSLADKKALRDPTTIGLNHWLHRQKHIRGLRGESALDCADCHQPTSDLSGFKPVRFERHCKRCHGLKLEELSPMPDAPHDSTDAVYRFVFTQYARIAPKGAAAVLGEVQARARLSEDQLINSTGCALCHTIEPRSAAPDALRSRFDVEPVTLPDRWWRAARFDHGRHQQLRCEACHAGARESRKSADVLLPPIKVCRTCHAGVDNPERLGRCQTCHAYHPATPLPAQKKSPLPGAGGLASQ